MAGVGRLVAQFPSSAGTCCSTGISTHAFERASVSRGCGDPGYRFAQPGANVRADPFGLLVCTPEAMKEISPLVSEA